MPRSPGNRAVRSAKSLTQKVARLERAKPKPAKPKRAKPKRAKPQHAARKSAPLTNLPIELYYWPTPNG